MLGPTTPVWGQATSFTYQGSLAVSGVPANGNFDLRIGLFATSSGGNPLAGLVTNTAVAVTNGLFTTGIDFGAVFGDGPCWLELGVRTNGVGGAFTTLSPRQLVTPTPESIHALASDTTSGPIGVSQLPGSVALLDEDASFAGSVTAGSLGGSGSGMTNIPTAGVAGLSQLITNLVQTLTTSGANVTVTTNASGALVIAVTGLGSAAFEPATAFDAGGSAQAATNGLGSAAFQPVSAFIQNAANASDYTNLAAFRSNLAGGNLLNSLTFQTGLAIYDYSGQIASNIIAGDYYIFFSPIDDQLYGDPDGNFQCPYATPFIPSQIEGSPNTTNLFLDSGISANGTVIGTNDILIYLGPTNTLATYPTNTLAVAALAGAPYAEFGRLNVDGPETNYGSLVVPYANMTVGGLATVGGLLVSNGGPATVTIDGNLSVNGTASISGFTAFPISANADVRIPGLGFNSNFDQDGSSGATGCQPTAAQMTNIISTWAANGMLAAGWNIYQLDDGWMSDRVGGQALTWNPTNWPAGMPNSIGYAHSMGFRFQIYISSGYATCCDYAGSHGYEVPDVSEFARWGVDWIKVDNCGDSSSSGDYYRRLYDAAIYQSGRPMGLLMSIWGVGGAEGLEAANEVNDWEWGSGPILAAGSGWSSGMQALDYATIAGPEGYPQLVGPGHYSDIAVLRVNPGLSPLGTNELRQGVSIMAEMASPIWVDGTPGAASLTYMTNREVLNVLQDPLVIRGTVVSSNGVEVVAKQNSGYVSVLMLNRTTGGPSNITVTAQSVGLSGGPCHFVVRDPWQHAILGTYTNSFTATVGPDDCYLTCWYPLMTE
jgi:alpha-galactosidase